MALAQKQKQQQGYCDEMTSDEETTSQLSASTADENVVCEDSIREKAYLLWEAAGRPEGGDGIDFWLQAEQILGFVSRFDYVSLH